ncbi:MerR family transcriptional regulator [Radicibacter daui]|uniref:MerR family transcriptional regulator n=1 Tax=Radicibacter daui TaxID=3064829 RepID=UPI0040470492
MTLFDQLGAGGAEHSGRETTGKSQEAFRTISEVSEILDVPQHVLRFWETKFSQVKPLKRGGGRRYYRPEDIEILRAIRKLLHMDGYTIKGVQKLMREARGAADIIAVAENGTALAVLEAQEDEPVLSSAPVAGDGVKALLDELISIRALIPTE